MKIFLSWSGKRSLAVACALREWIPLVLQHTEPWASETDIGTGERWADKIASELEITNCGIICLTRENVQSSWLLFEAGSLAKLMKDSRVIPYLLDLDFSDLVGPLNQFQAKKATKASTLEMIQGINNISSSPINSSSIDKIFEDLWPRLEKKLASIPDSVQSTATPTPHKTMEDLVSTIRAVDQRVRKLEKHIRSSRCKPLIISPDQPAIQILEELLAQVYDPGDEFTLVEAYENFEAPLSKIYPQNLHIKAKIRQKLQELRDTGTLEFLDNSGTYKLCATPCNDVMKCNGN